MNTPSDYSAILCQLNLPLQATAHSRNDILALRTFFANKTQVTLVNLSDCCRSLVEIASKVNPFPKRDMSKQKTALAVYWGQHGGEPWVIGSQERAFMPVSRVVSPSLQVTPNLSKAQSIASAEERLKSPVRTTVLPLRRWFNTGGNS